MTFVKPHSKNRSQYILFFFALLILTSGIFLIFEYNELVGMRHNIRSMQKEIIHLESQNVDLKNDLYALVDPRELEKVALEMGFVLERRPGFLNLNR